MPNKFCLLLAALLPLVVFPQQVDTLREKKIVFQDYLYINNVHRGSQNPTAISREALTELSEIKASYGFSNGDYYALDAANIQKTFDFSLYGIKKLKKIAFEGGILYSNISDREKRWNSTLFIAHDNPFIIADSIKSNFSTEKFHLDGGFSYSMTEQVHFGLRAKYDVGSSANQTDPRPIIDGMRFLLNPGVDYQFGNWVVGVSGHIEWMSESTEYKVVRTTDGTHYVFLFHGLGDPIMKTAIGYQRKYSGTTGGGNAQLTWNNSNLQNFLEIGYRTNTEEAEDGGNAEKYKGGKYKSNYYSLTNRFVISDNDWIHNINVNLISQKVNGTSYQQEQKTTSDGDIFWNVISSSICHKKTYNDVSLEYRIDKLSATRTPHLTVGIKGGLLEQKVNHYPELYLQKFSQVYGNLFGKKSISLKKYTLNLNGSVAYAQRLSDSNAIEGTVLADKYSTPQFEFVSGNNLSASLRAELHHPFKLNKMNSTAGCFAQFAYNSYTGDYRAYKNTTRQDIRVGVQLIF